MHRNKTIYTFVLFIILFFSSSHIGHASNAKILVDNLNVRSGPGTEYDVVGKVNSNENYPVIQTKNDWVEIQLDQLTGWVNTEYISIKEQTQNEHSSSIKNITILEDNVHIRSGPSIDNEIVFFAKKGTNFEVISEVDDWFEIKNDNQSGYIHRNLTKLNNSFNNQVLKDKVFVIDAGHGGYDAGAIGISGKYEKEFAYNTAKELKNALISLGAKVMLTRSNDEFIRLGSRVSFSNLVDPHVFISIHYNSFPESPSASGVVSHYYDEKDEQLANHIQEQIIQITGARDRGALYGDFQVLRHNLNPALLLELGFISNEKEEQSLLTDNYQKKLVKGIVNGLIKHFTTIQ